MFFLDEWSRDHFYLTPALQILQASFPHIILVMVNLLYIVGGAFMFIALESRFEIGVLNDKRDQLQNLYDSISNATYASCYELEEEEETFKGVMLKNLQSLSLFHDRTPYALSPWLSRMNESFISSWIPEKAMVYALTIITTTGYSELFALTMAGKVLSVLYGMIGIPLMFLTAADVGKLLSEVVTNCWARFSQQVSRRGLFWCLACCVPEEDVPMPMGHPNARGGGRRNTLATIRMLGFNQTEARRKQSYIYHNMPIEVPGWLICILALGYITISGAVFMHARGWQYIESVHFAFDAMTSITMGITPIDTVAYLVWLMSFCMFGLSVITMCLDLARMKLRNLFIRLHYFGVKFGENLLHSRGLDPEVLLLAEAIREMRAAGFDSMDISALLEYWMKKKEDQVNLARMMKYAYKPRDLDRIPLIDKKPSKTSALSREPSIASEEEDEFEFLF